jgi:hypothetical protein
VSEVVRVGNDVDSATMVRHWCLGNVEVEERGDDRPLGDPRSDDPVFRNMVSKGGVHLPSLQVGR